MDCFKDLKVTCIPEPARRVIAQERVISGVGTSVQNPELFIQLMLKCAVMDYENVRQTEDGRCLFDRGIPDLLAYTKYYGLSDAQVIAASAQHKYARKVFYTPAWADIFTNDADRKLTFKQAETFGRLIKSAYEDLGYDLHIVPYSNPGTRAAHILKVMRSQ